MSYTLVRVSVGEVGITPGDLRMTSTDTLGVILEPNYLTSPTATGVYILPSDIISAVYSDGDNGVNVGFFVPVFVNGVITLTQSEVGGDVTGPINAPDNAVALFAGNSGKQIKPIGFTPAVNSLFAFDDEAVPSNVTLGEGLDIVDNVLEVTAEGTGDVVGPESSTQTGVAFFANTTGKLLQDTPFIPTNNSLLGYNGSGLPTNITPGTNITISGGVISAAGAGTGDMNGPGSSTAGVLPVFADTSGKLLEESAVALDDDTLVGVVSGAISNITAGSNISIIDGVISATGEGVGNVTGPVSSVVGKIACYANTSGTLIGDLAFSPANNSLLGFGGAGLPANVTAGTGITISGNVISSPNGDVVGSGTSVAGTFPLYTDTTGKNIAPSSVSLTNNTLVGVVSGSLANITAGSNISISGGVISATGEGVGNVTGPVSSSLGGLVYWDNESGTLIGNSPFNTTPNSLLGFGGSNKPAPITAGAGITIANNIISATSSGGNVVGPPSSTNGGLALYSGTTGKVITNTAYTPVANTLVGYDSNANVSGISIGPGLSLSNKVLSTVSGDSYVDIVQFPEVFRNIQISDNATLFCPTVTGEAVTIVLPLSTTTTIPTGFFFELFNTNSSYISVRVSSPDTLLSNTLGFVLEKNTFAKVIYRGNGTWIMNTQTNYSNTNVTFLNNPSSLAVSITDLNKLYVINGTSQGCSVTLPDYNMLQPGWKVSFFQANTQTLNVAGFAGQSIGSLSGEGAFRTNVNIVPQCAYVTFTVGIIGVSTSWYTNGYIE